VKAVDGKMNGVLKLLMVVVEVAVAVEQEATMWKMCSYYGLGSQ
jgi:hypothetical protein